MTAEKSWMHYTSEQGNLSCGVLSVVVAECEALQLPVHASPEVFPEHCDIDFTNFIGKNVERKGKLLRDKAVARGWQYRPEAQAGELSDLSE
jgi:hypothetical protein